MSHNPDFIVRLLYGEGTAEKKTAPKVLSFPNNSLTFDRPFGQGHRLLNQHEQLVANDANRQPTSGAIL
jgi:hypothetical protein